MRRRGSFTEPTAIYVPGGVLRNPNYFKRVDRPYCMLVIAITDNAEFPEGEFTPVPAPATFRFWAPPRDKAGKRSRPCDFR